MLNILRKKKVMKRVLWALAILIIPAFVLWGAGSFTKRKLPYKYIGEISGKKVSVDEFIKSLRDVRTGLFLNYYSQSEALEKLEHDRPLLNRLAWENIMIKRYAAKEGITVTDKEVIALVTAHPVFNRSGRFDTKVYDYFLKNSFGGTARDFEESVRSFLVNMKYKFDIIKNVDISDEELLQAYKREFEKAKICYVVLNRDDFKERVNVSENEIASFYEKNKGRFAEDEKVVLQYIEFPHREEGARSEKLAELKKAYAKLKIARRDIEKAARDMGLEVKETPPFSRDEMISGLGGAKGMNDIAFRLRPLVDIQAVISEDEIGASYIVRVKEKAVARLKSQKEVLPYIMDTLKNEKAVEFAMREADKIYADAKAENLPLLKAAQKYNLKLQKTDFISRFDYIEGVGESYKIIDAAFGLKTGELSKPIEVRKGFAIVEPVEFQPIDADKFAKEKDTYRAKALSVKKMKALDDWFKKVSADATLAVDLNRF